MVPYVARINRLPAVPVLTGPSDWTGHSDYKAMKPYIDIAEKAKTDAMDAMEKGRLR